MQKRDAQKKILYISDLDGTLLRSNAKTSTYTNQVINNLTKNGMVFSYATARSYITATKCTEGLHAKIPLITYNGAVILQNKTYEIISKTTFQEQEKLEILGRLTEKGVCPIIYSYIEDQEKFSFLESRCNQAAMEFLSSRNDIRKNLVKSLEELAQGDAFYFTCIDAYETLEPLYRTMKDTWQCIFQRDIYSGEQWLEILPKTVSKANAILQLKKLLDIDYVIAFGDGRNDMEMFQLADEAYAVENAVDDLKALATGIIGSNDSDGVAKWLSEHFKG